MLTDHERAALAEVATGFMSSVIRNGIDAAEMRIDPERRFLYLKARRMDG